MAHLVQLKLECLCLVLVTMSVYLVHNHLLLFTPFLVDLMPPDFLLMQKLSIRFVLLYLEERLTKTKLSWYERLLYDTKTKRRNLKTTPVQAPQQTNPHPAQPEIANDGITYPATRSTRDTNPITRHVYDQSIHK